MSDLTQATRELFVRSVKNQVFLRTPVFEEMFRRMRVTFRGGKYIERLVDTAEITELGQAYDINDALTDEKKDTLDKPRFTWKYYQHPMRYDVDEYTQNITAGNEEQLLDLADHLVKKSQRGIRLALMKMMYNVDPTTGVNGTGSETGRADGSKLFQSLLSALDHDVTYGTLTRTLSSSTNAWWQGSDPSGRPDTITSSTQSTATTMSIANIRKWVIPVMEYTESPSDLYIVMCPSLWNKLRAECEGARIYQSDAAAAKYGIQKFSLDGHQVVAEPYLENGYGTSGTTENWVFLLNIPDWELRIHNARNFKMTDFKWQGEQANGHDYWLARIMLKGNLMCWKPNGSMWLNNVS